MGLLLIPFMKELVGLLLKIDILVGLLLYIEYFSVGHLGIIDHVVVRT